MNVCLGVGLADADTFCLLLLLQCCYSTFSLHFANSNMLRDVSSNSWTMYVTISAICQYHLVIFVLITICRITQPTPWLTKQLSRVHSDDRLVLSTVFLEINAVILLMQTLQVVLQMHL